MQTSTEKNIRSKLFRATFRSSPKTITNLGGGSYIEILGTQAGYASSFAQMILQYFSILILCAFYGLLAFSIAPKAALFAGIIGLITIFLTSKIVLIIKNLANQNVVYSKQFTKHLGECFQSWRIIKISNSYDYEENRNKKWRHSINRKNKNKSNIGKSILFKNIFIFSPLIII